MVLISQFRRSVHMELSVANLDQLMPVSRVNLNEKYSVRLAEPSELSEIYKLRYDIFCTELGGTTSNLTKIDYDEFDDYCDHLIVKCGHKIVGTYRLLPLYRIASKNLKSYCSKEFDLSNILLKYGTNVLELGRSCIDPKFRSGVVTKLLWKGISDYIIEQNIDALIGCASVHGMTHFEALKLYKSFLKYDYVHNSLLAPVNRKYKSEIKLRNQVSLNVCVSKIELMLQLPPLVKGYLNIGAKILSEPAYDEQFNCHDFLILLERQQIPQKYIHSFSKQTNSISQ